METIVILLMELLVHYAVAGVGASMVGMAGTVRNGSVRISSQPGDAAGREERMSRVEERLGEMGVTLPNLPTPIANYVPAKRAGNLVFTAGQVSAVEGREYKGKLGAALGIEEGCAATRACVINC